MRRHLLPLLALVLLAGCGSSSNSSTSAPASAAPASSGGPSVPSANTIEVPIKNFAFHPQSLRAKVGQTIRWVNEDSAPHNVVGTSGPSFSPSSTLSTGAKYSLKLTHAGTIRYICSIHPFMKATIVVAP